MLQRQKFIVGLVMIVGTIAVSTLAAVPTRKSAVVRFTKTSFVAGAAVIGPVVIEHDDEKMASGGDLHGGLSLRCRDETRGQGNRDVHVRARERPLATPFTRFVPRHRLVPRAWSSTNSPVTRKATESLTGSKGVWLLDHAAHQLWNAERKEAAPRTDGDWENLEEHATQIAAAGALIRLAGTGVNDRSGAGRREWTARSDVRGMPRALQARSAKRGDYAFAWTLTGLRRRRVP